VDQSAFENVLKWVESYGGYVHPALSVGHSTLTGTRGIIAKQLISEEELKGGPLIAIPNSLRMNAAASQLRLTPVINLLELPPITKFSDCLQTSLLLAFEKQKGSESFWAPYIAMLPATPSCAWMLPENELRIELVLLPSHIKDSEDCLRKAELLAMEYRQEIEEALEDYGDALGLEFDDVQWALGHVHSRSYGDDCSLIPILDLINHHAAAMPLLGVTSDDKIPMTFIGSFFCGRPKSLQPGDELFVNYSFPKNPSALSIFLHAGFLPQEFAKMPIAQLNQTGRVNRIGEQEMGQSVKGPV